MYRIHLGYAPNYFEFARERSLRRREFSSCSDVFFSRRSSTLSFRPSEQRRSSSNQSSSREHFCSRRRRSVRSKFFASFSELSCIDSIRSMALKSRSLDFSSRCEATAVARLLFLMRCLLAAGISPTTCGWILACPIDEPEDEDEVVVDLVGVRRFTGSCVVADRNGVRVVG